MILGIGSDLCDIDRIQKSLDRFGERFTIQRGDGLDPGKLIDRDIEIDG